MDAHGLGLARSLWEVWKRIARRIGDFQARAILSAFYFFVLGPFSVIVRRAGDPLALRSKTPQGWRARTDDNAPTIGRARSQF